MAPAKQKITNMKARLRVENALGPLCNMVSRRLNTKVDNRIIVEPAIALVLSVIPGYPLPD
jgi:hypothetical protein